MRRAAGDSASFLLRLFLGSLLAAGTAHSATARDVLRPDLERFDPAVRAQLQELVDEVVASGESEDLGRLGETYLAYELPEEADSALALAARLDPSEPRWPYFRALAALGLGERAVAAEHFDHVLELRPEHHQTLLRSASNLLDLGRLEDAASRFESARAAIVGREQETPRPGMKSALHFGLGRLAAESGRHVQAVAEFRRALELQPGADGVYYHLARALHRTGDADAARAAMARRGTALPVYRDPWTAAMKKRATGAQVDVLRGLKALKAGLLDDAERLLRRALDASPGDGEALAGLARVHQLRGEPAEAEALYRRALSRADPSGDGSEDGSEDVRVLLNLGALLAARGDAPGKDEALELFRRAVQVDPRSAEAQFNLGLALIRRGDAAGERALLRALELHPDEPATLEAVEAVARSRASRGEFDAAADVYRELLASPAPAARAEIHFALALSLTLGGRCAEARPVLDSALGRLPTDPAADALAGLLVRVLAACPDDAARDGARAVELARVLFQRAPNFETGRSLAMAMAEAGRFDEAAEQVRRLIDTLLRNAGTKDGATQPLAVLRRELEHYEAGEPIRSPWR